MNSLRFKAIAAFFAAMALFFAPVSASAYTPTAPEGGEITVAPATTFDVTFTGFQNGESVLGTLTGPEAADGNLAALKAAITSTTATKSAEASGNVTFTVTLPPSSKAGDVYTLVAEGETSGSATFTIYVVDQGAGGDGDGDDEDSTSGSGSLTRTGGDLTPIVLGVGGVILLVGAGIVFAARRQKDA